MKHQHYSLAPRSFIVVVLLVALAGGTRSARADLVALYTFEGTFEDLSGNELHGIPRNDPQIVTDPIRGQVLALDNPLAGGASTACHVADPPCSYVDISDPNGLLNFSASGPHQGSATVAAWVFSEDWLVHDSIFNQGEWRTGIGLSIKADADDTLWLGRTGPAEAHRSADGVPTGVWTHVAATWDYDEGADQTAITFYINGQNAGIAEGGGVMTGRVTAPIDNNELGGSAIGREFRSPTADPGTFRWPFSGRIDDLAIFSTALSEAEIQAAMAGEFGLAPAIGLVVDPSTGQVVIRNDSEDPVTFGSYEIRSAGGSLNPSSWNPISSQNVPGFPAGTGDGDGWEPGPNVSPGELVEWFLQGDSTLAAGGSLNLGAAFDTTVGIEDLVFRFTGEEGTVRAGMVEFAAIVPPDGVVGDYNGDGIVNAADYAVWRDSIGAATLTNRDENIVGPVGQADYDAWKANFGAVASGAALGTAAVPEPSSMLLAGMLIGPLLIVVRLRS